MEPWQEEARCQQHRERRGRQFPCCYSCGDPITTERYFDLEPFGLSAQLCEDCMEENTHDTWTLV